MRRLWKIGRLAVPILILAVTVFGFAVMSLWNWLVPAVFGGHIITFWQAMGLLVLSRILVGGFFKGHRSGWNNMTAEEREKFRAAIQRRCGIQPEQTSESVS